MFQLLNAVRGDSSSGPKSASSVASDEFDSCEHADKDEDEFEDGEKVDGEAEGEERENVGEKGEDEEECDCSQKVHHLCLGNNELVI